MASSLLSITIEAIDNASAVISGVQNSVKGLAQIGAVGSSLVGMGAAIALPIIGIGTAAVGAAMEFESSMANVAKAANVPVNSAQYRALSTEILGLSRVIPRAATDLAEISAEGAKLGVSIPNLGQFTTLMSTMAVAFDMTAQQAAEGGAKIANSFQMVDAAGQMDFSRLTRFGDVVNTLGDNMATTEAQIITFAQQTAGVASVYRMSESDVAGLGAAFTSLGLAPERAARAFNSTAVKLASATTLGSEAQAGFKALGVSATEMQTAFESGEGTDAYLGFLQKVKTAGPQAGAALSKIFGVGFSDEIMTAAAGMDQFTKAIDLSGKKAGDAGFSTMQSSFEIFASTTASQMQLLKNNFMELGIAIGSAILPAINSVTSAIRPMIMAFASFAQANPGIIAVGVAILGIVAAIGVAAIAVGGFLMAIAAVGTAIATISGGAAAIGLGAMFAPLGAAALLAAGLVAIAAGVIAAGAFLVTGSWEGVAGVFAAIPAVLSELPANLAQIPDAIGSMILAAQAIINNFVAGVRLAFATMGNAMTQAFSGNMAPAIAIFQGLIAGIGAAFMGLGTMISGVINGIVATISMIGAMIGTVLMGINAMILGYLVTVATGISAAIMGIITGIVAVISTIGMMIGTVIMGIVTGVMVAIAGISASIAGVIAGISASIAGAMAGIMGVIDSMVSAMAAAFNSIGPAISGAMSAAIGVVQSMAGEFAAAGSALMAALAQGIMAGASAAVSAVSGVAGQLRAMLPFSPAKTGPLSDLDKSGPALMTTIADGITATPILGALGRSLSPVSNLSSGMGMGMSPPTQGGGSSGGMGMAPPTQGGGSSGGSITLNYAPVINGDGRVDLIEMLRSHSRELMQMLSEVQAKSDRKSYT